MPQTIAVHAPIHTCRALLLELSATITVVPMHQRRATVAVLHVCLTSSSALADSLAEVCLRNVCADRESTGVSLSTANGRCAASALARAAARAAWCRAWYESPLACDQVMEAATDAAEEATDPAALPLRRRRLLRMPTVGTSSSACRAADGAGVMWCSDEAAASCAAMLCCAKPKACMYMCEWGRCGVAADWDRATLT